MAIKANYEFLFVGRDDNSFLENYYYDLFQDYGDKSGQVFVNLEVQNNPVDAEEIGNVLFETMQRKFFEDVDRDPYERFEVALKDVNDVLVKFKEQKFSGYIGNMNVIVSAIVNGVLYLASSGDAEAYMIRKKFVSVVSEGLSDDSKEDEVFSTIASGSIEAGDFVLFSSTRLLRYISKTDLAKSISKTSVIDSLNDLKDTMSTEILGRVGLTGISFEKATVAEEKALDKESDSATKSMLESNEGITAARKETLTGKFMTAFKGFKNRESRTEVFKGGSLDGKPMDKVMGWFKGFFGGLFSKKGFGKDKILVTLVSVILILFIAVVVVKMNSAERAELERLDKTLTTVQDKILEAETKGAYDKDTAKEILDKAYMDAMSVLNSGYYRDKAKTQLVKIEEVRDTLDNVQRIEDPKVLADLSAKREGVNALGLVLVGDRVFAYEYNALYEIVLDQVQDPLTIDDDEMVIAATAFEDRGSVVFLTKSGKLIEYKDGTMNFMDTDDGSFRKGVALTDWANRIYMLDPVSNQIWKYTYKGTRGAFGNAEGYIVDEDVDISKGRDIAIDANVYVLNSNGDVNKFYGGQKQEFYINDAPFNAFKDPTKIYSNEKVDEVYVLDAQESRILVFSKNTKTGNLDYITQYMFDGVGELRDMYIDPDVNKMYVLTESKLLETSL